MISRLKITFPGRALARRARPLVLLLAAAFSFDALGGSAGLTNNSGLTLNNYSYGGAQGDPAVIVSGTGANTAKFTMTNYTANTVVTLTLPVTATLTNGASQILVNTFTSNPASGTFSTDATGTATFYVGATRDLLAGNQAVGNYASGPVTVRAVAAGTNKNTTMVLTATVIAALTIGSPVDLNFGGALLNDPAKIIDPTAAPSGIGTVTRAQWTVQGKANTNFTVSGLPSSITMTTGDGVGVTKQIVVNNFHYYVAGTAGQDTNGALDGAGSRIVYVGATRAAILSNQAMGNYSNASGVTITVTY
jgi:hypothetical protein